jgi:hypothetical protein
LLVSLPLSQRPEGEIKIPPLIFASVNAVPADDHSAPSAHGIRNAPAPAACFSKRRKGHLIGRRNGGRIGAVPRWARGPH